MDHLSELFFEQIVRQATAVARFGGRFPEGAIVRGHCRECGVETEHVAQWNGKPVNLCPACSRALREQ